MAKAKIRIISFLFLFIFVITYAVLSFTTEHNSHVIELSEKIAPYHQVAINEISKYSARSLDYVNKSILKFNNFYDKVYLKKERLNLLKL